MYTMVTSIRGDQVSIHYSMGGSSSKVTNPKLNCLQVWCVNDEPLQILLFFEHNFNANFINLPPFQEYKQL